MNTLAHVAGFTCLIIAIFGSFGAITSYNINRLESVCVSAACSVIALAAIYLLALQENTMTYEAWKMKVDKHLVKICGLEGDDLPDWGYWTAWDDGEHPYDVACEVLVENGWKFEQGASPIYFHKKRK